jgi:hypothetical protein
MSSTRSWFLAPDAIIGQSPNGPGMEGGLNKKMAKPSTLALTGGNTDALPVQMNPGPENRTDPILPVFRPYFDGYFENGNQVGNFPGTVVGEYVSYNPAYGLLFHFVTPSNYTVNGQAINSQNNDNWPFEWVTQNTQMKVTDTNPDPATGGFVFESNLTDQFVGFEFLTEGGIWWSDPGEFYITLWAYFQDMGAFPYTSSGGFFQMGYTPSENGCQMYFYIKDNVPMVDIFFDTNSNPSGQGQAPGQVPMYTYSYTTNLGLTGQGLYQIGFYYKNDGKNITIGGSIGSMDTLVNFNQDPSGNNGPSQLHFIEPVTMPAPYGMNSLVSGRDIANGGNNRVAMGFSSSDPAYGTTPLSFIAYRTVIENTAATGNDPIAQIVADFNHFAGMVYTPLDQNGNPMDPVVGLQPTLNAAYISEGSGLLNNSN